MATSELILKGMLIICELRVHVDLDKLVSDADVDFLSLFLLQLDVCQMETVELTVKLPRRLEKVTGKRKAPYKTGLSRKPAKTVPDHSEDDSLVEGEGTRPTTESPTISHEHFSWKPVQRSQIRAGLDDAAVLTLEEIDDVDVVYEEDANGRKIAKLVVSSIFLWINNTSNSARSCRSPRGAGKLMES